MYYQIIFFSSVFFQMRLPTRKDKENDYLGNSDGHFSSQRSLNLGRSVTPLPSRYYQMTPILDLCDEGHLGSREDSLTRRSEIGKFLSQRQRKCKW